MRGACFCTRECACMHACMHACTCVTHRHVCVCVCVCVCVRARECLGVRMSWSRHSLMHHMKPCDKVECAGVRSCPKRDETTLRPHTFTPSTFCISLPTHARGSYPRPPPYPSLSCYRHRLTSSAPLDPCTGVEPERPHYCILRPICARPTLYARVPIHMRACACVRTRFFVLAGTK